MAARVYIESQSAQSDLREMEEALDKLMAAMKDISSSEELLMAVREARKRSVRT